MEEYRIEYLDSKSNHWEIYDITSDRQDAFEIYENLEERTARIVDSSDGYVLAERNI